MTNLPATNGDRSMRQRRGVIVVTTETIPGYRIVKTIGLARGNTVRARHVGVDIVAALKTIVGGEVDSYTKMIAESREQSLDRMADEARRKGANAVVCARFTTSTILQGAAELLAYGTAVIVEQIEAD